jgi:hypothetical protein
MQTVFEYLIAKEDSLPGFKFDRTSNNGMVISYQGYKHMDLFEVRDVLQKVYKLKFDFDKGLEEFDSHSSRTYVYFKNVYTNE